MDEKLLMSALSAIGGALLTYVGAVLKYRKELEYKYDTSLRDSRIKHYAELWKLLEDLAKYIPPRPFTGDVAWQLSANLRHWYFQQGGMFLSDRSRVAYFDLQDHLTDVIGKSQAILEKKLDEPTYESLRKTSSSLRRALVADVGSRKAPQLA